MIVKKFVFCALLFTQAINSGEENNSDNKKFSISTVEEDISINKNNWNTRKWGSIYFLIPHFSVNNFWFKFMKSKTFVGDLVGEGRVSTITILAHFLFSTGVEYKYIFHKNFGVNIRLNLNNLENISYLIKSVPLKNNNPSDNGPFQPMANHSKKFTFCSSINFDNDKKLDNSNPPSIEIESGYTCFSIEFAIEWIWKKEIIHTDKENLKTIYSSSFSPIGFAFFVRGYLNLIENLVCTGTFIPLKVEFDKASFVNLGKIKFNWHTLPYLCKKVNDDRFYNLKKIFSDLLYNFFSLEFGINIVSNKSNQEKIKDSIKV